MSELANDGRRVRWAQHTQERRDRIIVAAVDATEAAEPGETVHLQEIAFRAGVNRTVVYRYFDDRADLDDALRKRVFEMLEAELASSVLVEGTVREVIHRSVGTYIRWADEHPSLHRLVERDLGSVGKMTAGAVSIITSIRLLVEVGAKAIDVTFDDEGVPETLTHAILGAVVGATRRWTASSERMPSMEKFTERVSDIVWFIVHGHAQQMGATLRPEQPLDSALT